MMSNAIYPAFPGPAAVRAAIATGELRDRLGFEGVSITDALGGRRAQAFGGPATVGLAAAAAGTDLLLFTEYPGGAAAAGACCEGLRAGSLPRARVRALRAAGARPAGGSTLSG